MENVNNFILCFSLGICFILLLTPANAENRTEPRLNANLSPFESWRSSFFCLLNTSKSCSDKNTLTLSGLLAVQETEIFDYCSGGCYEHTLDVMRCIQDVNRDFKFEKAPFWFVKDAIVKACRDQKAFNITYDNKNSATSLYGRLHMPLVSTLTTLALIATFNV